MLLPTDPPRYGAVGRGGRVARAARGGFFRAVLSLLTIALLLLPAAPVAAISVLDPNEPPSAGHAASCGCVFCCREREAADAIDSDESGASAFTFSDSQRWRSTAVDGTFSPYQGEPTTLTWSIVPDGTRIAPSGIVSGESSDPSDLVTFLDTQFGESTTDPDLTTRSWFSIFASAFDRFAQLTGLTYQYEPNDDGLSGSSFGIDTTTSPTGLVGVRGDIRIGGHSIDGGTGSNVLAYNYFAPHGDMVLDTDNTTQFSSDNLQFRNILMHEHGHGLGLRHVEPVDQTKLMEPFLSTQFEGPQVDDILALHRGYGDVYEKSNEGLGNDTAATATSLGLVTPHQTVSIGTDAADSLETNGESIEVLPDEVDFISIDDNSDVDYLSFSIAVPRQIQLLLTPVGPEYLEGNQNNIEDDETLFNTSAQSDLNLTLLNADEVTLASANLGGIGVAEQIMTATLMPGEYFVRVGGAQNAAQLYQLDVTAVPEPAAALAALLGLTAFGFRRRA